MKDKWWTHELLPCKSVQSFTFYPKNGHFIIKWVILILHVCLPIYSNYKHSVLILFTLLNYKCSFRIFHYFFFQTKSSTSLFEMFLDPYSEKIDLETTLSHRVMNRLNNLWIPNIRSWHSLLILKYLPFLNNSTYFHLCAVDFHNYFF